MRRPYFVHLLAAVTAVLLGTGRLAASEPKSAAELARRVDALLDAAQRDGEVVPAAAADDAEFLRRLTLDLNGRIPTVAEVRAFLADDRPDKRRRAIDERLADPRYVRHFTNIWRALLLAQANPQDVRYLAPKIETWLARQLADSVPYDVWVRALLTAPLDVRPTSRLDPVGDDVAPHALAFFQANELKPENLAAATARVFLGVNLDCAQCHNHPFADWKQQQFWQFAAFYSGVGRLRADNAFLPAVERTERREIALAGGEQLVQAAFLDGKAPAWESTSPPPRAALADWVTSPDNRFFARAAANRIWAHLFGRGLVEPLDGLGGREPPTHPELLDELAAQLAAHEFDVRHLLRALTLTQAYQRTSRVTHDSHRDAKHYARVPVRGLTAEQVYDSLLTATGGVAGSETAATSLRQDVLLHFASLDRPTETPTSITQALTLMNGRFIAAATDVQQSRTLAAVIEAPFLDIDGRIETLFLAALSRRPTTAEADRYRRFVREAAGDAREAYADVFWALLNGGEFLLNH